MLDPSFSFLSTQALTTPCTLGIFACFWSYHLVHFSMMFRGNTGASTLLKKDGGFPKTRFPWCFWRKLPTNKSCPPMCSIEGFEIFEPWEVQQLWQGRRKVGALKYFVDFTIYLLQETNFHTFELKLVVEMQCRILSSKTGSDEVFVLNHFAAFCSTSRYLGGYIMSNDLSWYW